MPNKKKRTAEDLTKLLDDKLGEIAAGGNLNLKLSFVSSFAQALNEQDTEEQSDEDVEANKKVITFFLCSVINFTGNHTDRSHFCGPVHSKIKE